MRSFALALAVFWSLQALVCLSPAIGATAAGHHHDGSARAVEHAEGAAHSHAPVSAHHPESGHSESWSECAQHCASLSQTVAASLPEAPPPTGWFVAIVPTAAVFELPRMLAGEVARLGLGRSPPDLLTRNATLRI